MLPFNLVAALGLAFKVLQCVLQVLTFKLSAKCSAPTCVIFRTGKLLLIGVLMKGYFNNSILKLKLTISELKMLIKSSSAMKSPINF